MLRDVPWRTVNVITRLYIYGIYIYIYDPKIFFPFGVLQSHLLGRMQAYARTVLIQVKVRLYNFSGNKIHLAKL